MSPIVAALIQYVAAPLIGVAVGWIGGWFHHKRVSSAPPQPTK